MYFLWKRTPHGSIRVSRAGFSDCVNRFLSGRSKSRCRSLSVAEGENAAMTLVLSAGAAQDPAAERCDTEKRLAALMTPLGFRLQVIWADRGSPGAELSESLSSAYHSPWTWMLLASLAALKFTAGWKGFFWTVFWGTAAWFVSKTVISALNRR